MLRGQFDRTRPDLTPSSLALNVSHSLQTAVRNAHLGSRNKLLYWFNTEVHFIQVHLFKGHGYFDQLLWVLKQAGTAISELESLCFWSISDAVTLKIIGPAARKALFNLQLRSRYRPLCITPTQSMIMAHDLHLSSTFSHYMLPNRSQWVTPLWPPPSFRYSL